MSDLRRGATGAGACVRECFSGHLGDCLRVRITLFLVTTVAVCPLLANTGDDKVESIADRFRSEAPSAWEILERAGSNLQVECLEVATTRRDSKPGAADVTRKRLVFKARPGCLLSDRTRLDQSDVQTASAAEALNDDYGFTVTRNGGTTWMLRRAGASDKEAVARNVDLKSFVYAHAPWVVLEYGSLRSLWVDPHFDVTSVERVADGACELARVEFSLSGTAKDGATVTLRNGWLLLDPKIYWCIREYSVSIASDKSAADIHGTVTYDHRPDELPRPRRYAFTLVNKQKGATVDYSYDYEKFDYVEPAVGDFRLSAYGLPEYLAGRGSSPSLTLPALIVFAAGLLLVIFAARLRRRGRLSSDA